MPRVAVVGGGWAGCAAALAARRAGAMNMPEEQPMRLFGRGKPKGDTDECKPKEGYLICPHCYVDLTVERVREAGGASPSRMGKIDLDRISRARL